MYYSFLPKIDSQRHFSPRLAKPTVLQHADLSPTWVKSQLYNQATPPVPPSVGEKFSVRTLHTFFRDRLSPAPQKLLIVLSAG